jgi:hypothetical protein
MAARKICGGISRLHSKGGRSKTDYTKGDVKRVVIENEHRSDRPIEFLGKVYDGEAVDFVVHLQKLKAMAVRGVSEKNAIGMIWRHEAQGRWFRWAYGLEGESGPWSRLPPYGAAFQTAPHVAPATIGPGVRGEPSAGARAIG